MPRDEADRAFNVFLIHAVKDRSLVESIRRYFRASHCIRIKIAEKNRRPGFVLTEKIKGLIEDSHFVVVLWSHHLEKSIMCNHEIGYAIALNKPVIPFIMSGMDPKGLLAGTEYIEFDAHRFDEGLEELETTLEEYAAELLHD